MCLSQTLLWDGEITLNHAVVPVRSREALKYIHGHQSPSPRVDRLAHMELPGSHAEGWRQGDAERSLCLVCVHVCVLMMWKSDDTLGDVLRGMPSALVFESGHLPGA